MRDRNEPKFPADLGKLLAEVQAPWLSQLRKTLDAADEMQKRTGIRPDVRKMYRDGGGTQPLPDWFK
jgi:hypothetical protein